MIVKLRASEMVLREATNSAEKCPLTAENLPPLFLGPLMPLWELDKVKLKLENWNLRQLRNYAILFRNHGIERKGFPNYDDLNTMDANSLVQVVRMYIK